MIQFEGTVGSFLKRSYFDFKGSIERFYADCEFEENNGFSVKRMVYISGYLKIEKGEDYEDATIIIAANHNFGQNPLTNWYGAISIIPDETYRKYFVKFTSSSSIGANSVEVYEIK